MSLTLKWDETFDNCIAILNQPSRIEQDLELVLAKEQAQAKIKKKRKAQRFMTSTNYYCDDDEAATQQIFL